MLKYDEAYLELNEAALKRLMQGMSDKAVELALAMAPNLDDEDEELEAEAA